MSITLAITTYNRYELLKQSFEQVIDDPRIDEILIMDDASEWAIYEKVNELTTLSEKIKVVRQASNRGMMQNKRDAIAFSKNEWVIIFDSDNGLQPKYIDGLQTTLNNPDTIYCPSFAAPNFDYRSLAGLTFDKYNIRTLFKHPFGEALLNTCNYFVPKTEYLRVFEANPKMKATDTIYMNYLWLKAGNKFKVVNGMEYFHRVHNGSGFMADVNYNMAQSAAVKQMILSL